MFFSFDILIIVLILKYYMIFMLNVSFRKISKMEGKGTRCCYLDELYLQASICSDLYLSNNTVTLQDHHLVIYPNQWKPAKAENLNEDCHIYKIFTYMPTIFRTRYIVAVVSFLSFG